MTAWYENHEQAEAECKRGWEFEERVAARFRSHGLSVLQDPKVWRAHAEEAFKGKFTNELDMAVNGLRISVKSRRVDFTDDPSSIPDARNPLFVDTARKWGAKTPPPFAAVCVSQTSEPPGMVWIPAASWPQWETRRQYDAFRGYADDFLVADRHLWHPFEELPPILHSYYDGRWWLSTGPMTGTVTVHNSLITADECTPIFRRFVGQPFLNIVKWLRGMRGDLRSARL